MGSFDWKKMKADQQLNHSAAHLLAAAILKLYPDTKLAIGPAIDEGFYYDFEFSTPISNSDLPKIQKMMFKIANNNYSFLKMANQTLVNQTYKQEMINELKAKKQEITYYGMINQKTNETIFIDLCRGGHIKSTKGLKFFKLISLAGAYWRGDSKNIQLTRIYGTAWKTEEELNSYLKLLQERKERDHRKIGKEMEIFMFSEFSGQGFPIWLKNGMIIKNQIKHYLQKLEIKYGFSEVQTPVFGEEALYKRSGHLDHYREDMFPILKVDNENLVLRPMNCPHHIIIYQTKMRSYRELPIRISEHAFQYRYEKSGALMGLERVRSMELTDSHIFCRHDQIVDEFKNVYQLINEVLNKFKIEIDYISLSLHDPNEKNKYYNDSKMWENAENSLKNVLNELNLKYEEKIGEAAFYGPKIDIQVKNALGHEITMSTLQLDFLLPQKFDIKYVDKNQQFATPVIIHRGLIGTYERFIAILLEQYKGDLPFWIAPRQIVIIPVNKIHQQYCKDIKEKLQTLNLRVHVDDRDETLGKKIREANINKTKIQIVIGNKEIENQKINVRYYGKATEHVMDLDELIKNIM